MAVLALAVPIGGCAWLQEQLRPRQPAPPGWAIVEADQVAFDGWDLSFRLLVGATDGGVVLDRRLVPNASVELTETLDCDAGTRLRHIFADFFPPEPLPSDLLELEPGTWFGKYEQVPMFVPRRDGGGLPACVDAAFTLHLEAALNPSVPFRVRGSVPVPVPVDDAGMLDP